MNKKWVNMLEYYDGFIGLLFSNQGNHATNDAQAMQLKCEQIKTTRSEESERISHCHTLQCLFLTNIEIRKVTPVIIPFVTELISEFNAILIAIHTVWFVWVPVGKVVEFYVILPHPIKMWNIAQICPRYPKIAFNTFCHNNIKFIIICKRYQNLHVPEFFIFSTKRSFSSFDAMLASFVPWELHRWSALCHVVWISIFSEWLTYFEYHWVYFTSLQTLEFVCKMNFLTMFDENKVSLKVGA